MSQQVRRSNRLLFLLRRLGYAPRIGSLGGDGEGPTLLHSGTYLKRPSRSGTQRFLKKRTSRKTRRNPSLPPKGNHYRKLMEYQWIVD